MPWPFFSAEIITCKLSFTLSLGIIAADCFPCIVTDKVVTSDYSTAIYIRIGLVCAYVKNIIVHHWVNELPINQRPHIYNYIILGGWCV